MVQVRCRSGCALNPFLEVHNLSFAYPEAKAPLFSNVNFALHKGEVVAILGLSGSGKSTFAFCLCGIIPHLVSGALQGEVLLEGKSVAKLALSRIAQRIGIVFQDPDTQLFFPQVGDEIAFGPENLCLPPAEIRSRIGKYLDEVGMAGCEYAVPHDLSGGQKQLVALASTLSLEPQVVILDEVTSQLDSDGKRRVLGMISELKKDGRGVVIITHDLSTLEVADRVLVMRQGGIEQFGGEW